MENLARSEYDFDADKKVKEELQIAGIPVVRLGVIENEDAMQFVSTLRGNKHLILGNNCKATDQRYRQLFVEVVNYKEVKDIVDGKEYHVVMSHYPIAFWNHQHHYRRDGGEHKVWAVQLYGHVHASNEETIFQEFIRDLNEKHDIKCIAKNVGCMLWNYTPVTLKQILEKEKENIKNR